MKKLLYSKKITNKSKELLEMINIYCSKLNKEYSKNMIQLVLKIAEGENLDGKMLIDKYITKIEEVKECDKPKDEEIVEETEVEEVENVEENDSFLDKIIINGECYYYQSIENGIVYNKESKQVGVYKNKKVHIN